MYIHNKKRVTGLQYLLVITRPSQQMETEKTLFEFKLCSTPHLTRLSLLASGDLTRHPHLTIRFTCGLFRKLARKRWARYAYHIARLCIYIT